MRCITLECLFEKEKRTVFSAEILLRDRDIDLRIRYLYRLRREFCNEKATESRYIMLCVIFWTGDFTWALEPASRSNRTPGVLGVSAPPIDGMAI